MYRLIFTKDRETFVIEVLNKEVYYSDRKMLKVRMIPRDESLNRLVIMSRNKIPKEILQFFNLNEEEQKQYDTASTEEQIVDICINDCVKKNFCILQKKEKIE